MADKITITAEEYAEYCRLRIARDLIDASTSNKNVVGWKTIRELLGLPNLEER